MNVLVYILLTTVVDPISIHNFYIPYARLYLSVILYSLNSHVTTYVDCLRRYKGGSESYLRGGKRNLCNLDKSYEQNKGTIMFHMFNAKYTNMAAVEKKGQGGTSLPPKSATA